MSNKLTMINFLKPNIKPILNFIIPLLIITPIAVLIKINCPPIIIIGDSMYPTYKNGEITFSTNEFQIEREMVVVADIPRIKDYEGGTVIKRIVAIGGDKIEIIGNELYINNVLYVSDESFSLHDGKKITLQDNEVFLLGDNYGYSYDSREFGAVTIDKIKYKIKNQKTKK